METVLLTDCVNSSRSSIVGFLPFASIQESKAILLVVFIGNGTKAEREKRRHFARLSGLESLPIRSEEGFPEGTV